MGLFQSTSAGLTPLHFFTVYLATLNIYHDMLYYYSHRESSPALNLEDLEDTDFIFSFPLCFPLCAQSPCIDNPQQMFDNLRSMFQHGTLTKWYLMCCFFLLKFHTIVSHVILRFSFPTKAFYSFFNQIARQFVFSQQHNVGKERQCSFSLMCSAITISLVMHFSHDP